MTLIDLEAINHRIEQAKVRKAEFVNSAKQYYDNGPSHIEKQISYSSDEVIVRYVFKQANPMPNNLRLTFGEVVHQLRSLCDNVVVFLANHYSITGKNGKTIKIKRLFFPFYRDTDLTSGEALFARWSESFQFPEEVLMILRKFQPYTHCSERISINDQLMSLSILNDLWNIDKHNNPIALVGSQDSAYLHTSTVSIAQLRSISQTPGVSMRGCMLNGVRIPDFRFIDFTTNRYLVDGTLIATIATESDRDAEELSVAIDSFLAIKDGPNNVIGLPAESLLDAGITACTTLVEDITELIAK